MRSPIMVVACAAAVVAVVGGLFESPWLAGGGFLVAASALGVHPGLMNVLVPPFQRLLLRVILGLAAVAVGIRASGWWVWQSRSVALTGPELLTLTTDADYLQWSVLRALFVAGALLLAAALAVLAVALTVRAAPARQRIAACAAAGLVGLAIPAWSAMQDLLLLQRSAALFLTLPAGSGTAVGTSDGPFPETALMLALLLVGTGLTVLASAHLSRRTED
ncbi:hypothetical protein [Actinoplanes sp. NBRC 101535]|uniref:hypothetical protein n=1 Tax=Actinoplanes sp. NBRC 101535 TaxID=3032196 RepID=UPI002553C73F|nr:hypothetical protein [Actinoplanes sp. NBRC 101535]